jgi:hypothetical protein
MTLPARVRRRLVVSLALVATAVLGEAGVATASDDPSPSAQPQTAEASGAPNHAPVAVADTSTVTAGQQVTIHVVANDTDEDGDTLHLSSVVDPAGRAVRDGDDVTFTAGNDDSGPIQFSYVVTDGTDQATGTVTVTVKPLPARAVTLALPKTVVALRSYSLAGVANRTDHAPVDVAVQRYYSGAWHAFGTDRADADGDYAVPFSTSHATAYTFRAIATWHDGKQAKSATLRRTVVGRVDQVVSGPLTAADVPYSWRRGCPVAPSGLRRITLNRWTYSGTVARGSVVVRTSAVPAISKVFTAAFAKHFRVRSMKPTDAFYEGGRRTPTQSDVAAMRADNTSAFNCRPVTGNPYRVSQHSYGNAVDINTVRNPYVVGRRVYPGFARTYLNRGRVRTGMITRRGVVATTMRSLGWPWGARWVHPDYQHFSSNGG